MPNPAMTLYGHFCEVKKLEQESLAWPQAWERVVEMSWPEAVGPLLGLIDQSKLLLSARLDLDVEQLMLHEGEWRRAILLSNINLDTRISQSGFALLPPVVSSLYSLAAVIKGLPESGPEVAEEQVARLAEAVESLRQDLLGAAEVEEDLRSFLLDLVNRMQARIDRRRVAGTGPILDLLPETIASSAVHSSLWDRALRSPVSHKVLAVFVALQGFGGFVNSSATAIENVSKATAISANVIAHVLGDGPKQLEAPKSPLAITDDTESSGNGHAT